MTASKIQTFARASKPLISGPTCQSPVSSCTIVVIGATGDLASRKLFPALFNLFKDGALPKNFALVGSGRFEIELHQFKDQLLEGIKKHSRTQPVDMNVWDDFAPHIYYCADQADSSQPYENLNHQLSQAESSWNSEGCRIFYFATPSSLFPVILNRLHKAELISKSSSDSPDNGPLTRVVFEKPFGRDLESACALNENTWKYLDECQLYRMDHYLGKETVQNILVFRFGNAIFDPVWNRKYIDHVRIIAAEDIGVPNRGNFYEETGVIRDVVQNHLLQLLALCAMEAPVSFDADRIRDERCKVFRSLRPIWPDTLESQVSLGQYRRYRDEANVATDSRVPTYASMRVFVDNWRWEGVPFIISAGKSLDKKLTQIEIHFRPVPFCLFGEDYVCSRLEPNVLRLGIQPDEGISLRFGTKTPGEELSVAPVDMDFSYRSSFEQEPHEAYEKLLLDCMRGDRTLFARRDEVELMWKFVDPILNTWESQRGSSLPLTLYESGSPGPEMAP